MSARCSAYIHSAYITSISSHPSCGSSSGATAQPPRRRSSADLLMFPPRNGHWPYYFLTAVSGTASLCTLSLMIPLIGNFCNVVPLRSFEGPILSVEQPGTNERGVCLKKIRLKLFDLISGDASSTLQFMEYALALSDE